MSIIDPSKNKAVRKLKSVFRFNKKLIFIPIIAFALVCLIIIGITGYNYIKNLPKDTDTYQTLKWNGNKISKINEGEYIPEDPEKEEKYVYDGYDRSKEYHPVIHTDKQSDTDKTENTETDDSDIIDDIIAENESNVPLIPIDYNVYGISEYTGEPYTIINDNIPYFTDNDIENAHSSFEYYSPLDGLGRCGVTIASVGQDIMPSEERGKIGMVKPSGWNQAKYDFVDGKYLYNRCHLIGYQLAGENANECNLITGTRYLNVDGMLPFENEIADYVRDTGNHVLYRVTPLYSGDEPLARGVLMEAESIEDDGKEIKFNVFCYNVQPGVKINYTDGSSELE